MERVERDWPVGGPVGDDAAVEAAIVVDGLHMRYEGVDVLAGVSFEVHAGEVFALLGPNGAGKTTTVEILEGHRRRTGGRVNVLGFDPERGGVAFRERIGIVLQDAGLDAELKVGEVLSLFASLFPHPREVDEVVSLVHLDAKRRSRVRTLSGGQRRRLDLALGLVGDPDLLFLDEPTIGFDPTARRQAWEMLDGLRALGKTVVLTTHYMDEVQRLADRVLVLYAGRAIASGPPTSLGARDRGETEIRFKQPPATVLSDIPSPAGSASLEHGEIVVRTRQPTVTLAAIAPWAVARGVELEALSVTRPSLEDVLLDLVADAASATPGA